MPGLSANPARRARSLANLQHKGAQQGQQMALKNGSRAKRPVGDPYAIQHLHSAAFGMYIIRPNDFHMSATKDHLVFNLTKETANLWLTAKRE